MGSDERMAELCEQVCSSSQAPPTLRTWFNPSRYLVEEGRLSVRLPKRRKYITIQVHLFSDHLLVTKPAQHGGGSSDAALLPAKFFLPPIPLKQVVVADPAFMTKKETTHFELDHFVYGRDGVESTVYQFKAKTVQNKTFWLQLLQAQVRQHGAWRRRRHAKGEDALFPSNPVAQPPRADGLEVSADSADSADSASASASGPAVLWSDASSEAHTPVRAQAARNPIQTPYHPSIPAITELARMVPPPRPEISTPVAVSPISGRPLVVAAVQAPSPNGRVKGAAARLLQQTTAPRSPLMGPRRMLAPSSLRNSQSGAAGGSAHAATAAASSSSAEAPTSPPQLLPPPSPSHHVLLAQLSSAVSQV